MHQTMEQSIAQAHEQVVSRFIHQPFGIVLDYAGKDGRVPIPTRQDCEGSMPNALSWWVSTENGAFFTGLYLYGLIHAQLHMPDEARLAQILRLIGGLFRLQDVCRSPGMIARGLAEDGSSHYALGSDDQTGPWLLGLYSAWRSGLLPEALREEIAKRAQRLVSAIAENSWEMPTEWPGQNRGEWRGGGFREAARLLFACRACHAMGGGEKWLAAYRAMLHEKPEGAYRTRLQICADGFSHHMIEEPHCVGQFWIYFSSHAALYELLALEGDEAARAAFRQGLRLNGVCAAPYIAHYRGYDNENSEAFDVDWRKLAPLWEAQSTVGEAVALAQRQHSHWTREMTPRKAMEYHHVRQPLYAAWVALLSGDEATAAYAREQVQALLLAIDWRTLYTSEAYVAECAYYAMRAMA